FEVNITRRVADIDVAAAGAEMDTVQRRLQANVSSRGRTVYGAIDPAQLQISSTRLRTCTSGEIADFDVAAGRPEIDVVLLGHGDGKRHQHRRPSSEAPT